MLDISVLPLQASALPWLISILYGVKCSYSKMYSSEYHSSASPAANSFTSLMQVQHTSPPGHISYLEMIIFQSLVDVGSRDQA